MDAELPRAHIGADYTANPKAVADSMLVDPVDCFGPSYAAMHGIPREQLEAIQLAGLKSRFSALRDAVPMLKKLADEAGVHTVTSLDDVVPILFRPTVYKSYPVSLLEKGRFPQMTQWLQKLTITDLSKLDVSHCTGIDEWMAVLDKETPLNVGCSSGTSGTMSFVPRTVREAEKHFLSWHVGMFELRGQTPPTREKPLHMDVVHGSYRRGASSHLRLTDRFVKYICGGDESKLHCLYPHSQSSDLMFLAGRMRAAEAKGELDRLAQSLSPALLARQAEFAAMQRAMPGDMKRFFDEVIRSLEGKQIFMTGVWNVLYKLASAGIAEGLEGVFASNSVINTGGGAKGENVPPDWEDTVKRFFGVPALNHSYGMSEVMATTKMCQYERYHMEPWSIFYVLNPDTSEPLPRKGVQTGRAAFYDLQAETYWGGFVTGDEVTVDWNTCKCGRKSPHIARKIDRYTDMRGGDDKISCAAAPEAHESALKYLTDILG